MPSSSERLIRALRPLTNLPKPIIHLLPARPIIILQRGRAHPLLVQPAVRVPVFGLVPDLGVHGGNTRGGHEEVVGWDDVGLRFGRGGEGGGDGDGG